MPESWHSTVLWVLSMLCSELPEVWQDAVTLKDKQSNPTTISTLSDIRFIGQFSY